MKTIYLTLLLIFSCKSVDTQQSKQVYKQEETEKLSLDDEFKNYKEALSNYKKSEPYLRPISENEKTFNGIVEAADLMERADLEEILKDKRFSLAESRMDDEETSSEEEESAEEPQPDKKVYPSTKVQKGFAIFSIVMGSLGILGVASRLGYEAKYAHNINKGLLAFIPLASLPIIAGSIYIADKNPDSKKTNALQATLMAVGVVTSFSGMAVGFSGVTAPPSISKKLFLSGAFMYLFGLGTIISTVALNKKKRKKWEEEPKLALTQTREESIKECMASMGRAFIVFKEFEKQ